MRQVIFSFEETLSEQGQTDNKLQFNAQECINYPPHNINET